MGTTIPLGERVSGWVAATHHSALNSDARLDVDDDKRAATPLRSTLAVAVTSDESLSGVLSLYATEVEAFNEKHRRLLLSAAAVLTCCVRLASRVCRSRTRAPFRRTLLVTRTAARPFRRSAHHGVSRTGARDDRIVLPPARHDSA